MYALLFTLLFRFRARRSELFLQIQIWHIFLLICKFQFKNGLILDEFNKIYLLSCIIKCIHLIVAIWNSICCLCIETIVCIYLYLYLPHFEFLCFWSWLDPLFGVLKQLSGGQSLRQWYKQQKWEASALIFIFTLTFI